MRHHYVLIKHLFKYTNENKAIGGPKNIVRSPIKKLYWSMPSVKERSVIYAIGGVILPNEPEVIT